MTKQQLEVCINEYGREIYSFCNHLTCNQQEADDLYQDTFLKFVELASKVDYKENPKSYLLSIALRIWKNKKRKFAWRRRIADTKALIDEHDMEIGEQVQASPEEQILSGERTRMVRQAVDKLPERFRIPVLLFYMEDLPTAQIAAILKIPTGTVLSRLYQARKLLKKELESVLDEQ